MQTKSVRKNYEKGITDFRDVDLKGHSFKGKDLQGLNFSGADIRGTDFTDANLQGAIFNGATAGLTPLSTISMSLLSLILSVLCVSLFSITSYWFWQHSSVPIADIITYCTAFLIAFPIFIFFIIYKGATAALLFLAMAAIGATLAAKFSTVAIAIALIVSLVMFAFFFVLGWRIFAILPMLLLLGALSLAYFLNSLGGLPLQTQSFFDTFARNLGTILSITVAEALTLAMSVTTLGCIGIRTSRAVITGIVIPMVPLIMVIEKLPRLTSHTKFLEISPQIVLGISIGVFLGAYIGRYTLLGNEKYILFRKIGIAFSTSRLTICTRFKGADLTNVDFTKAKLQNTDFRDTNLTFTNWFRAQNLQRARVEGTYLQYSKVRKLVINRSGENQNFDRLNLQGINCMETDLRGASLIETNLSKANLRGADLSGAKLLQTQLFRANLQEATITGAYIQDWEITSETNIDRIKCEYLYLGQPTRCHRVPARKPENEQETLSQKDLIELINDAEEKWQKIYSNFDELINLKDTVIRERWEERLIESAKECGIPLARYRHMWEYYCDREFTKQLHQDWWKIPLMRIELRVERLNRLLTQMDLFPILENMGRLSILIAVVTFFVEIPQRRENSEREKIEAHYRAWEMIRESKEEGASNGRIIALELLNKDGKTLANLQAPGATLFKINLSNANLTSANLKGANLNKANLSNAILDETNLSDAVLKNADLRNTNLHKAILGKKADLSGTDLRNANLTGMDLTDVRLDKARLSGAILDKTNLSGANLRNINLETAKLKDAIYDDKTEYNSDKLNPEEKGMLRISKNVELNDKDLQGKDLRGVDLSKADLSNANLSNTDLRNTNLIGATLKKTKLDRALYNDRTKFPQDFDLSKSIMYKIAPNADLNYSDLGNKDLSNANLSNANLSNANLSNADLSNAKLSNANLGNAYLMNADLSKADLSKANLDQADLHNANLVNAKGLTPKQVQAANNWKQAIYSEDFRKKLGLQVTESE